MPYRGGVSRQILLRQFHRKDKQYFRFLWYDLQYFFNENVLFVFRFET